MISRRYYIGLSGKFVPINLYNLINVLKFKFSAFQFSFNTGTNFPDNSIYAIKCENDLQYKI